MATAHPVASQMSGIPVGKADFRDETGSGDEAERCELRGVNCVMTIAVSFVEVDMEVCRLVIT